MRSTPSCSHYPRSGNQHPVQSTTYKYPSHRCAHIPSTAKSNSLAGALGSQTNTGRNGNPDAAHIRCRDMKSQSCCSSKPGKASVTQQLRQAKLKLRSETGASDTLPPHLIVRGVRAKNKIQKLMTWPDVLPSSVRIVPETCRPEGTGAVVQQADKLQGGNPPCGGGGFSALFFPHMRCVLSGILNTKSCYRQQFCTILR
jgi:hypothetical protein